MDATYTENINISNIYTFGTVILIAMVSTLSVERVEKQLTAISPIATTKAVMGFQKTDDEKSCCTLPLFLETFSVCFGGNRLFPALHVNIAD